MLWDMERTPRSHFTLGWEVTRMPGPAVSYTEHSEACLPDGRHRVWGGQAQCGCNSQCREEGHSYVQQLLRPPLPALFRAQETTTLGYVQAAPPLPLFLSLMPSYQGLPRELHGPCISSFWLGTNHALR